MSPLRVLIPAFALTCMISHAEEPPKVLAIGSPAPAFSLPGIEGKTHTLADYAGAKVLAVFFTCNHCPEAVAAAPRMEAMHQDYKDKGVAIVAVNGNNPNSLRADELGYSPYNDSFEEMKPFAAEYKWSFPYLYDGEAQTFTTACGAQATPHVFIFDAERKLRYTGRMDDAGRSKGPVEKSYVRNAIDALLAGTEVKEPVTRSVGCSTKWLNKKASVAADNAAWENQPVTVADLDIEAARKLRKNDSKNLKLINFWSTTCAPCVAEFPNLVDAGRRYQARNFEFVSISFDPAEDRKKVETFLTKRHAAVPGPIKETLKAEGRTTNNYHWTGGNPDALAEVIDAEWTGALPHSVLVEPGGKIVWRHSGEIDADTLRREMLKVLDQQER